MLTKAVQQRFNLRLNAFYSAGARIEELPKWANPPTKERVTKLLEEVKEAINNKYWAEYEAKKSHKRKVKKDQGLVQMEEALSLYLHYHARPTARESPRDKATFLAWDRNNKLVGTIQANSRIEHINNQPVPILYSAELGTTRSLYGTGTALVAHIAAIALKERRILWGWTEGKSFMWHKKLGRHDMNNGIKPNQEGRFIHTGWNLEELEQIKKIQEKILNQHSLSLDI